ncbi:RING-H2 finger protein ATL16-like [Impatiens glandulifera]|uniref:RING-H2 finger protein ATL16-like n=1 Tax=Impatiens glandulifera TaxID=253017 RepID=UPI001FB08D88|nr:RING-H2 finger protein ATL16-like [Impatiens glandulifera]
MVLVLSPSQLPPPPPPPSPSLRPLLYYALVMVATAALILALYNIIILRLCSEHRRRHHSRQSEAQRSINDDEPTTATTNIEQICSFKFKKEMGIQIHEEEEEQGYEAPECSICLSVFEEEDELKRLPRCMHCFHSNCIDKWFLNSHINCPLCRAEVVVQSKETNQLPVMNSHVVILLPV